MLRVTISESEGRFVAEVSMDGVAITEEADTLRTLHEKLRSKEFFQKFFEKFFEEKKPSSLSDYADLIFDFQNRLNAAFEKALLEYLRLHTKAEEFSVPNEASVYLAKLLYVAYEYVTLLWQDGITLRLNGGRETYDILAFKQVGLSANGETISWRDVLEKHGLDPSKPYNVTLERTPYLWFYLTDDMRLIISDSYFKQGLATGYLSGASPEKLREIFENMNSVDRANLFREIERKFKINPEEGLEKLAEVTFFLKKGLSDEVLDYFLQPEVWNRVLEKAFPKGGADPFIYKFYGSYVLPFFRIIDSPHALLFTPTRRAKTLMAKSVQDDEPVSDASPASLIGGIDPSSKKPVIGVLHSRDIMLQVESLETKSANETLRYALEYMANGFSTRLVGLNTIRCSGTAPLVFTGNTLSGRVEEFSDTVRLLLSNPEALGSRTLFFYLPRLAESRYSMFNEEFHKAWKIIKGVRSNRKLKRLLRKIWESFEVETWLQGKVEFPDKVESSIEALEERGFGFLATYLRNVFKYSSRRLRALALNNVLLKHLPEIWFNKLSLNEVLEEAEETLEYFKGMMIASLGYLVSDIGLATSWEIVASLPYYIRAVIYAASRRLNEQLDAKGDIVEMGFNDEALRNHILNIIDTKKWSYRKIEELLRKKIPELHENTLLRELGISFTIKDNEVVIQLRRDGIIAKLAPSEIEELLQIKKTT